jgi:hypothetical protein
MSWPMAAERTAWALLCASEPEHQAGRGERRAQWARRHDHREKGQT